MKRRTPEDEADAVDVLRARVTVRAWWSVTLRGVPVDDLRPECLDTVARVRRLTRPLTDSEAELLAAADANGVK